MMMHEKQFNFYKKIINLATQTQILQAQFSLQDVSLENIHWETV